MTIKELRKQMRGLDENLEIYTADHDHSEWETNGKTFCAEVRNQSEMNEHAKESLNQNPEFKIDGDYFVINV